MTKHDNALPLGPRCWRGRWNPLVLILLFEGVVVVAPFVVVVVVVAGVAVIVVVVGPVVGGVAVVEVTALLRGRTESKKLRGVV
ncbi:hypothetical protein G6F16_013848 [Rhizopus arrhizus]|nr:hypothetical protein G6F24_018537 [Rhizopus arrhizus]KAG1219013.1 hypothetical protein G6F68_021483 [Rhizopus microsporus]KAG0753420.1 hypothetical protein G6F22_021459 [Rhizopus arrhizus]KAG0775699.1 hypothetical protein G6F21_013850 [Rhizopus arrhizus]KAG0807284.1 hypothetical protein G6F19_013840 [Rhizopus arrhizus]